MMANSMDVLAISGLDPSSRSRLPVFKSMYSSNDCRLPFFKSIASNSDRSFSINGTNLDDPILGMTRMNSFNQILQEVHGKITQTEVVELEVGEESTQDDEIIGTDNDNFLGVVSSDDEVSVLSDISTSISEKEFYYQHGRSHSVCSDTTDVIPSNIAFDHWDDDHFILEARLKTS